jgi:hypothetical protein
MTAILSSFDERYARRARGTQPTGACPAPASERDSIWSVIAPADGTRAATVWKRRLRYVCVFGLPSDKPLLACSYLFGISDVKHNGWTRN